MATPPRLQVQPQSSPLPQRKPRNETDIWTVIDELKEKVDNLEQENKELKEKVDNLEQENKELKEKVDNLEQENKELKEKVDNLEQENKELRNEHKRMFVYLQPLIGRRLIEALKNVV
jgi:FtsZ-binding cell division protein ZapB